MTEWDRKGFNKCICASFTAKSRVPRISVNPRCSCLARSLAFLPGERYEMRGLTAGMACVHLGDRRREGEVMPGVQSLWRTIHNCLDFFCATMA